MTTFRADPPEAVVAAALAGDESAFAVLVERHRRALHVHCYRMLGSYEEAEDVVQETFLRAWRAREGADGGSGLRAWLYRIATNACLDAIRRSRRRVRSLSTFAEVPWLQPYPDRLLDEVAPGEAQPEAIVIARETIELAFITVIQLLPPRQRAVLVLRDVLGWSASETAALLELTVAAANSALQRARATLRGQRPAGWSERSSSDLTERERELLEGFIATHENGDVDAAVALLRADVRVTMPPYPWRYEGLAAVVPLIEQATGPRRPGDWRLVPTRANRQPAAASYLRAAGDTEYRAFKLDVLRVQDGAIAEITTFGAGLFPAFGLPAHLRYNRATQEQSRRCSRASSAGFAQCPTGRQMAETSVPWRDTRACHSCSWAPPRSASLARRNSDIWPSCLRFSSIWSSLAASSCRCRPSSREPATYAAAIGPSSERVKPIDWATLMPLMSSTALSS